MSVFRVKLQNIGQGQLDMDPTTASQNNLGSAFTVSKQRTIYVMGPKKINRKLRDGETFTDCNYWKRFTADVAGYDKSFIEVVSDDGSVYSDVEDENTFAFGGTYTLSTSYTTPNTIDFANTYGSPAKFMQVTNNDGSIAITGELNASTNVTFTLAAGETQVFNHGDLPITKLRLKSASGTPTATVIAAVKSAVNS
jgi:hypothetical protein